MRKLLFAIIASAMPFLASASDLKPLLVAEDAIGSKVVLYSDTGPCEGNAKLAHYSNKDTVKPSTGCYVIENSLRGLVVRINWFDGDNGEISVSQFKPVNDT